MTKHTPGHWKYYHEKSGDCYVIRSSHGALAETFYSLGRDEANARLIAAAPDLLEALEEIITINNRRGTLIEAARVAQEAIRKATE